MRFLLDDMDELVERLRSDEERESEPDAASSSLYWMIEYSQKLSEAERDISGIIERHAGEIHEIYENIDEDDVSERETALMYAYGQLAQWVVNECGTPEQQKEDLMRRLTLIEESDSR
jgi:hypothetical protein